MEVVDLIKDIAVDTFKETSIYDGLKRDFESVQRYQESLQILTNTPEERGVNILRIGTILSFSVIGKILKGKRPKEFSAEDWRDVADNVAEYGVKMDGQKYTVFVFELLARYIDFSVEINKEVISEQSASEIKGLAADIRYKTQDLESGKITEPAYVDDCLWISFEAVIKLLAAYRTKGLCKEYAEFIQAVADISVQYGRFKLYQKELALINGYLEGQKQLDEQLAVEYQEYLQELKAESDQFNMLIEHAFCDDFDKLLRNSVELALNTGVDKEMILDSTEKIDSFFLG